MSWRNDTTNDHHEHAANNKEGDRENCSRMGPQKSQEGWIIFVTGLHDETEEDDLKEAFSEYGKVQKVCVNRDRLTGLCKGYALVEYGHYTEAQDAINSGHSILGKQVGVDWAFVKPGPGRPARR